METQIDDLRLLLFSNVYFIAINFHHSTASTNLCPINLICFILSFDQFKIRIFISLKILLTYALFQRMLFSFQLFGNFLVVFLLLNFNLISLVSEKNSCITSVHSNLLRFILLLKLWPTLANVLWILEKKNVFCWCWVECFIYLKQILLVNGLLSFSLFLMFCLAVLSIVKRGLF